jgi:predicted small metal-binding protein
VLQTGLMHRFLQQINVKLTTGFAGTDNEPVLVSMLQPLHINTGVCAAVGSKCAFKIAKSPAVYTCHCLSLAPPCKWRVITAQLAVEPM